MEEQGKRRPGQLSQAEGLEELKQLFRHHIESFDYLIDEGLDLMLKRIFPPQKDRSSKTLAGALYPFECRQAKISYTGSFHITVCFQYDGGVVIREKFNFGEFPIMLRSKRCYLREADPTKLVACKEEAREMGGFFILNGLERLVRALIMPKRNYPMSVVRDSFRDRREGYTDKAVVIRCVRGDLSSVTVKLYYLQNGSARLGFWLQMKEYMLPVGVVLKFSLSTCACKNVIVHQTAIAINLLFLTRLSKFMLLHEALIDTNDHEIYKKLTCCYSEKNGEVKGAVGTQLIGERAKIILDEAQHLALFTQEQCLQHIGEHFQPLMEGIGEESYSAVADALLRNYIFVHLDDNNDKFNLLIFMVQKLFSLVDQTSTPDNTDSLQNQEILLAGHLITIYLKINNKMASAKFNQKQNELVIIDLVIAIDEQEKLEDWMRKGKLLIEETIKNKSKNFDFNSVKDIKKVMEKNRAAQVSSAIENLLKTGTLLTQTGLDLQQRAGFTIQAERLNYLRFISFFRSVHRGASFAGLRTTSVRKLLPESWGFLCPVHTPDGEPCGLLNHMTSTCLGVGMTTSWPKVEHAGPPQVLPVLLDGRVIGSLPSTEAEKVVAHLRRLKVSAASVIPDDLEVGYVPLSLGGTYPGLYLFTSPSRFIRPVRNISIPSVDGKDIELIGPFEQVFMEIRCPDGGNGGRSNSFPATHEEVSPTVMLSVVANLTPWSDHNQSPRNMYQCQMAKQTMAFSLQAINARADQKLYHLQTPQSPIVRTKTYTKYCIDEYPSGTNVIVAVLAYTGYDMEDAMILKKSSVERGMCHGQIFQKCDYGTIYVETASLVLGFPDASKC
ncbi:hypothetical protein COLO4_20729 [Corchorus olitorius]|uniref:DNA-directed RNA polymerase n=1 Tax=Corchorus olitorius TaxID=93759 RepID=A0A1R3IXE4_9ROSI|nr:hypothetical protein COLO4_20729 [Corchorus olitorius]